jgi:centractin
MDHTASPIVLDNGSGILKAGYAGSDLPDVVFQNFVGKPKHERVMAGVVDEDLFVGRKAEELRGILRLSHPMSHGVSLQIQNHNQSFC